MTTTAFLRRAWHWGLRQLPGYDARNWLRVAQIEEWQRFLSTFAPAAMLEISPGWNRIWRGFATNTYESVEFPEFDICFDQLDREFDVVIADQVLEHVRHPVKAVRNIHAMLRPGGYALAAAPFLFRVHGRPADFTRWTTDGLKQLFIDGGFSESEISVASWGNKSCARSHIGGLVKSYGFWRPMKNDVDYPMMVWAIARKPDG